MPYYDSIAAQWHRITGHKGGAFKELVFNEKIIASADGVQDQSILEVGAGSGYFMPLLLRRFSGQAPAEVVITDVSEKQLQAAQKHFKIEGASYLRLDACRPFPLETGRFDLVVSTMVFNEIGRSGLENAVREIRRVLKPEGAVLVTVLHPDFIERQVERGVVVRKGGMLLLPGTDGVLLPVVRRSCEEYQAVFSKNGLGFEAEEVFGSGKVFSEKPALRALEDVPVAWVVKSRVVQPPVR